MQEHANRVGRGNVEKPVRNLVIGAKPCQTQRRNEILPIITCLSSLHPNTFVTAVKSFEILRKLTSCAEEETSGGWVSGDKYRGKVMISRTQSSVDTNAGP